MWRRGWAAHRGTVAGAASIAMVVWLVFTARPVSAVGGNGHRQSWWRSEMVQRRVGLNAAQVGRIEVIYRRALPDRRRLHVRVTTLEKRLARVFVDGCRDSAQTQGLIDRVTEARRRSNVARTLMLVEIFRVLSPWQRARLAELSTQKAAPVSVSLAPGA